METIKFTYMAKVTLLIISAMMLLFLFSSCAKKASFLTSSVEPAARGNVKVKKDRNNNYIIKIQLSNLAESSRMQPSKNSYIVWMVTNNNITKNIGRIKSSTGLLSKNLKASFETVSAFKPARIFITAEDDPNIQYPGDQVVLSTDNF